VYFVAEVLYIFRSYREGIGAGLVPWVFGIWLLLLGFT